MVKESNFARISEIETNVEVFANVVPLVSNR